MKNPYKILFTLFLVSLSFNLSAQPHIGFSQGSAYTFCWYWNYGYQIQPYVYGGHTPYHFQWTPSLWLNNDTISTPICIPVYTSQNDTTVIYKVMVTDSLGGKDSADFYVYLNASPPQWSYITSTAQNNTICTGMSTVLQIQGDSSYGYFWSNDGSLSSSTGMSVIATPTTTTWYFVTISDNGCTGTSAITIQVNNCSYNILHGKAYNDLNANGARDPGEYIMPNSLVNIAPAASVFSYIYDSTYTAYVDVGNFTVTPYNIPYFSQTTSPNISFTGFTTEDTLDVGLHAPPGISDLKVDITPYTYISYCTGGCLYNFSWLWPYSYGSVGAYSIHYRNMGSDILNGVLKIKYDSLFDNLGTSNSSVISDSVLSVINDTLTWQYHNLMPGEERYFYVSGSDTNAIPGQMHQVIVIGYPLTGDAAPANNYDTCYQVVLGSWDPNFKEVAPKTGLTSAQVAAGTPLTYTIHFQNTGNDTAHIVKVRDTLSAKLNMATFEMIIASHPYSLSIADGNKLEWKFNNIMLPDSGANQIMSNGYVKYRISPYTNLNEGDSILNKSAIYFDYNTPITTNTVATHIIPATAINETNDAPFNFGLYPNPANNNLNIVLPKKASITICNIPGQIIKTINPADKKITLDITGLPEGVYFIKVISEKGMAVKKFIKQ